MNKLQLINIIAKENDITKDMASKAVNSMIKHIMEAVKNDEPVLLVGFGTFRTALRKTRQNPHSEGFDPNVVKTKRVPKFTPGAYFKQIVSGTSPGDDSQNK